MNPHFGILLDIPLVGFYWLIFVVIYLKSGKVYFLNFCHGTHYIFYLLEFWVVCLKYSFGIYYKKCKFSLFL